MKKNAIFLILILISGFESFSQSVGAPNFIHKSHETLEVMRISRTDQGVTLQLLIRNTRNEGGSFCIDKNTEITALGKSYKITEIEGIPECPETHKFKFSGDNLIFYLHFPPIPSEVKIIDIKENCDDNCFHFKGLVVDPKLNNSMHEAFDYYETGMLLEGLSAYKELLTEYEGKEAAVEGLFYFYIINILKEIGNEEEASKYLEQFKLKNLEDSQWVLDKLEAGDTGLGF